MERYGVRSMMTPTARNASRCTGGPASVHLPDAHPDARGSVGVHLTLKEIDNSLFSMYLRQMHTPDRYPCIWCHFPTLRRTSPGPDAHLPPSVHLGAHLPPVWVGGSRRPCRSSRSQTKVSSPGPTETFLLFCHDDGHAATRNDCWNRVGTIPTVASTNRGN